MPSAANAKSEKPASSEASDNTPIRQIMTIIEHKIRNLEKRKSKLTSYRDLQKAGKELNGDQKVAVAKYDEVVQTLEFARDISKQVIAVATVAERDAKKQAKKDAWVRYTAETNKIREVLLVLDCLMQMGNTEAREDFLNGTNGAAKLTEDDLRVLDELYPEVTPKHEVNEEGLPGFHSFTIKAAEHLYAIIDGKPKEFLGTTYAHIKEIISAVHDCGYFDKTEEVIVVAEAEECPVAEEEVPEPAPAPPEPESAPAYVPPAHVPPAHVPPAHVPPAHVPPAHVPPAHVPPVPATLPAPPAPAGLPAPTYPLRPLPPITLQEVEHAYFAQQYPQQRPITEVIGSQNFFFLQESEIDSPVATPQPPPILNQQGSPAPIPTQTFTNQHYVLPGRVPEPGTIPMPPQPHFPPHPDQMAYQAVPIPAPMPPHAHAPQPVPVPQPIPQQIHIEQQISVQPEERKLATPVEDVNEEDSKESRSPERDDGERKTQGQGDGQNRFRRFRGGGRGSANGFRGRGSFQNRQNNDNYHGRHSDYQNRPNKDGYRQYSDNYQSRHGKDGYQSRSGNDNYYGNGDTGDSHHHENGGRERYSDHSSGYQGGFKSRGRGGPRGARGAPRAPRPQQYARKPDNAE